MSRSARSRRVVTAVAAGALALGVAAPQLASAAPPPTGTAPGAPGTLSRFDLARKDCVGTARSGSSKVWFTVADGVLSDVYEPTIDNTDVHSLQYVVTDGSTFTDLQQRDTTYTVQADPTRHGVHGHLDQRGARLPARDHLPHRPGARHAWSCTRRCRLRPRAPLHVYARLDAHVNGNGGGGDANGGADDGTVAAGNVAVIGDPNTVSQAVNRDYAVPTYMALDARSLSRASVGYAGTASDGLTQLDATHTLTPRYAAAPDGHVVATADVTPNNGNSIDLALGFGRTAAEAVDTAGRVAAPEFRQRAAVLPAGLAALRRRPAAADARRRGGRLLPQRQRAAGQPGQDVPGRAGRLAGQPVGPGGQRRRPGGRQAGVLRLLPRGLLPRPLRGRHRLPRRRRRRHRAGGDPLPVRTPAAGRRPDAAQLAAQRQGGAGHRRRPARRDGLPDPDDVPDRARRGRRRSTATTSCRRRTSSSRTARRSATSGGRSSRATRRRPSPPRSPASPRRRRSPRSTATPPTRSSTTPSPTTSSAP